MTTPQWITKQDPETMPFRPGVTQTQGFGLRVTDIGSPLHLGTDRGREPRQILMPFDGNIEWAKDEGLWGSLLRITPADHNIKLELHIAHTVSNCDTIEGFYHRGDVLPVIAGDLGLSAGIHTHLEVIVPYTVGNYEHYLPRAGHQIYSRKNGFFEPYIETHCRGFGLDYTKTMDRAYTQVQTWGISKMYEGLAIRDGLPPYRRPSWGMGQVILLDSRRYLKI
jgi:hypothetical protein